MTKQAENSIALYKGNNPDTIMQLLDFQSKSVVDELKEHYGVNNNRDLAVRLSMG